MSERATDHDLAALARQFEASDLVELYVKTDDFALFLSRDPQAGAPWEGGGAVSTKAPAKVAAPTRAASAPAPAATAAAAPVDVPEGMTIVRAPYLGTFYRAPKPGEPNFCEIGDSVAAGADLCLVEVMKLFTAVRAESAGVVRHVYAVDGQIVEEGAPLFALEPAA